MTSSDSPRPPSASDSEAGTVAEEQAPETPADPAAASSTVTEEEEAPAPPPRTVARGEGGGPPQPPDEDEEEGEEDNESELGGKMTFLEHLDELRKRILYSILSLVVTFTGAWFFREEIFNFLATPIRGVVEELHVIKPTEPFTIYLKVSFAAAIFLAIPFILFQVWLFIAPGLYRREKRFVLPFLLSSTVLFVLGGAFAYYVVLPPALNFLLNEFGAAFKKIITAVEYFDFVVIILVGMGAMFQLPVLVAFLSMFGLVTPRFLIKNFRYAFLLITIIAAVVSPTTDPFNLFLWSGPMVLLYGVSIGVSWMFQRRRKKRGEE